MKQKPKGRAKGQALSSDPAVRRRQRNAIADWNKAKKGAKRRSRSA